LTLRSPSRSLRLARPSLSSISAIGNSAQFVHKLAPRPHLHLCGR
jgi:hypothetical protein